MASAILQQLDTYGPQHCEQMDYAQAAAYTRELVRSHYENFTVVSWFLPRRLREDFGHVYAFCRWADDLGDETGDPARSLELLAWWRRELDACYAGEPRHPVFVALAHTIERHRIPARPFEDLIDAFVQDQTVTRYDTWEQVLDYCRRSADPVGRLVLYLCGHRDELRQRLSDRTCTALQLANFWQDVRRDILERDRVYLPREVADLHGLDIEAMASAVRGGGEVQPFAAAYRATLTELVERTWPLFAEGRQLWPLVASDVRLDIQLFTLGGEAILRMIRKRDFDTLTHRPSLSKGAKLALMMRAAVGKLMCGVRRDG
jgi:squalene synthase HpnC